jgi:hypothetical protein
MIRRKLPRGGRALLLALGITLMLSSWATPALSASVPTLNGTFSVEMTITKSVNAVDQVGDSATRDWVFEQPCAGCSDHQVLLHRERFHGGAITDYTLSAHRLLGSWIFKGTFEGSLDCLNADGSVAVANGYTGKEVVKLDTVDLDANNVVTGFSGTFSSVQTPTPEAQAVGCDRSVIKAVFHSV